MRKQRILKKRQIEVFENLFENIKTGAKELFYKALIFLGIIIVLLIMGMCAKGG